MFSLSAAAVSVVLVHGAFVDGSGWEGVHQILRKDGYEVRVVQHPTRSLTDDVTETKRVIATLDGPVVLVGHSYGGVIITEAGTDPKVAALVYVAALVPDAGESAGSLTKDPVPGAPVPPILPPQDGFLRLDRTKFHEAFAADLPAETAAFMADSQLPWGLDAVNGAVTEPAWKSKPSFAVVGIDDRMIPASAQRAMAQRAGAKIVEAKGSHVVFISDPAAVAAVIKQAADSVGTAK